MFNKQAKPASTLVNSVVKLTASACSPPTNILRNKMKCKSLPHHVSSVSETHKLFFLETVFINECLLVNMWLYLSTSIPWQTGNYQIQKKKKKIFELRQESTMLHFLINTNIIKISFSKKKIQHNFCKYKDTKKPFVKLKINIQGIFENIQHFV